MGRWYSVTVSFTWSPNSGTALYRWFTKELDGSDKPGTCPDEGQIVVTSMSIRVPVVRNEPECASQLKQNILKNPEMLISFCALQTHETTDLSGKRKELN